MTHTVLKFKRVWTQEVDDGLFLVKGLSFDGRTMTLKRYLSGVYDFVENPAMATKYKPVTATNHVASITKDIAKGRVTTFEMTDNRTQPDLYFVVLQDGDKFRGLFNRAEKAEEACEKLNEKKPGSTTYKEITSKMNILYEP